MVEGDSFVLVQKAKVAEYDVLAVFQCHILASLVLGVSVKLNRVSAPHNEVLQLTSELFWKWLIHLGQEAVWLSPLMIKESRGWGESGGEG